MILSFLYQAQLNLEYKLIPKYMTLLLSFIILFVATCFKATGDIIRVKQNFRVSMFANLQGNKWCDPEISWKNQHSVSMFLYPFWVHFSDLWHFCNSMFIGGLLLIPFTINWNSLPVSYVALFFIWYIAYGVLYEFWRRLFLNITSASGNNG